MAVLVWVTERGWVAAVEGALRHSDSSAELVLAHVVPGDLEEVRQGAFAVLLGRGRREADPEAAVRRLAEGSADELLAAASERAGNRPVRFLRLRGRPEREVVAAAAGADLLVVARDGDGQLGPPSLGPQARFVVDHAPCPVLLVWPGEVPAGGPLAPPGDPPRPPG